MLSDDDMTSIFKYMHLDRYLSFVKKCLDRYLSFIKKCLDRYLSFVKKHLDRLTSLVFVFYINTQLFASKKL
jgi:hypothetical protein